MSTSLYLINPACDVPTYHGGEVFGASGMAMATSVADLATTTVAAMAPADVRVAICDEDIAPADLDTPAQVIGLTGKVTQLGRMIALAAAYRARGKTVLIGGPYASLDPEALRPHCDILVRGELEGIAEGLFADLSAGRWKEDYEGGRPEITGSPIPRWDLYRNDRALVGCVQTSRGCPYQCEFCDVIEYLGRKQRFKTAAQVLAELDVLRRAGYSRVLISDDNFTVARRRAKEVLAALRHWNAGRAGSGGLSFMTQASIEAAEDEELIRMCADAGLNYIFIGIETPNEASLRETKKTQNLRGGLLESIDVFIRNGIAIRGGMIVGFDSDGPDIFERMYDFAMSTPIPIYNLGSLVAPAATQLFDRMALEGRLIAGGPEAGATPFDTNIIPRQMGRDQLLAGIRRLAIALYRPEAFLHRLRLLVDRFGAERRPAMPTATRMEAERLVGRDATRLVKDLRALGPAEEAMCRTVFRTLLRDPATNSAIMEALVAYSQVRYLYARTLGWAG
jgi:hypothetical protein